MLKYKNKCDTKTMTVFQNGMTCYGALSLVLSWCGASTQSFIVTPFGFKRGKDSGSTYMLYFCECNVGYLQGGLEVCSASQNYFCLHSSTNIQLFFTFYNNLC